MPVRGTEEGLEGTGRAVRLQTAMQVQPCEAEREGVGLGQAETAAQC